MIDNPKTEKLIRYSIIFFLVGGIMFSFIYKSNQFSNIDDEKNEEFKQVITVIKEESPSNNPIVGIIRTYDNSYVYIVYEVLKRNNYKFNAIGARKLSKFPDEVKLSQSKEGIWLLFEEEWVFIDNELNVIEDGEPLNYNLPNDNVPFDVKLNENGYKVTIHLDNGNTLSKTFEKFPLEIVSLANDKNVFLAIFEQEMTIITENAQNK